jgi:peptide/nickel transport system substrate-binding protein
MKKSLLWLVSLVMAMSFVLAACSGNQETTSNKNKDNESTEPKTSEPKSGGIATYAVDQAPEGFFDPAFSGSIIDSEIQDFITEGVYKVDDNLKYVPNIATWEISEDKKTYTFTFKKGVKWHNGEELTVEDWKYALEVLAHPDYDGPRFNYVENVVGAKEMKEGKADHISGIEVVDPYTIKITFNEVRINNLESLWPTPMPRKHYEGIAVKDLSKSDQVRKNPVGLGPFKVKSMKSGEYVELERFDDYWQGKPLLDGVIVKVIDPSVAAGALQKGEIDLFGIRPNDLEQISKLENVRIEETSGVSYSYIGLRFGHRDKKAMKSVPDFDKFKDKKLRQALLYAINRPALIDAYLGGKAKVANTVIPSVFWVAADEKELNEYKYDPEKAKELLKEAGYVDKDGDGFVEDPSGNKFTISFGHYAGPATFEGRAQAIIQSWRDIGIDAKLATGSLIEFNLYNEMKDNDDKALEAFFGSWYVGADPDPTALWGSHAEWNYGRYVDEEGDALIKETLSEKAFDEAYRKEAFVKWQKHFNENLYALPLWEIVDLYAVNKRLQGVHVNALSALNDVHKWYIAE